MKTKRILEPETFIKNKHNRGFGRNLTSEMSLKCNTHVKITEMIIIILGNFDANQ